MQDAHLQHHASAARSDAMARALGDLVSMHERDDAEVTQRLGRRPAGLWRVAKRGADGQPLVIAQYPLLWRRGKPQPMPNVFWLVCPVMDQRVSDLERQGAITQLQQRLGTDADFRAAVDADHAAYALLRWAMLTAEDQAVAIEKGWEEELRHRGVGGLTPGSERIKCLHAHLAHHLVVGSAIGKEVLRMMGSA